MVDLRLENDEAIVLQTENGVSDGISNFSDFFNGIGNDGKSD